MAIRQIGCEEVVSLAPCGLEWKDDGIATFRLLRVLLLLQVLLLLFGFRLVGVSFISFRGFLGSSESEFVFYLEFVVKKYFKINLSFVHFFRN